MRIHGAITVEEEQEEGNNANAGASGLVRSNQRDCMAIFRNRAAPAPPPVQPPPAESQWNKRLAMGPPSGFGGVRQPPQKRHQSGALPPHRQQAQRQYQKPPTQYQATPAPAQPPPKQCPQPQHMRDQASQQHQPHQMQYPPAPTPAQPPQMHYQPAPAQAQPPQHMQYQPASAQAHPPLLPRARQYAPTPAAHHAPSEAPPPAAANTNSKPRLRPGTAVKRPASAFKEPSVVYGVCDVRCMTAFHLKQHEKGRKHQNKVGYAAGEMNVWCDVCTVLLLTKRNVQDHYSGKRHLQRASRSSAHGSNRAT